MKDINPKLLSLALKEINRYNAHPELMKNEAEALEYSIKSWYLRTRGVTLGDRKLRCSLCLYWRGRKFDACQDCVICKTFTHAEHCDNTPFVTWRNGISWNAAKPYLLAAAIEEWKMLRGLRPFASRINS